MKSINNLREYAGRFDNSHDAWSGIAHDLSSIADAIEREVKELTDERDMLKRQWEAGVDFDQRLEACADKREDVTLWGVDYTALPVDADGVPIHVGDVMENIICPPVHREVTGVGVECFYGWDDGNGRYSQFGANCYRHHHAPTVEDMLTEMVAKVIERGELTNGAAQTIAEYAAKLQPKED